ncbi:MULTISPECIES: nitrite reductase small subunit NirD [Kordiimonas]|uniref:nitrite reductase small subunit NirD n=1 Tax=Kordiimonas TaxID=288021 RepID=UPI00257B2555|nr:nitrite reductase small subunit NirD [Kordiimonas sp. UBA4487]
MPVQPTFTLVCHIDDIPARGARRIYTSAFEVALFRTSDNKIFALKNECPHKKAPLSEGIVHGHSVACPLHNWVIDLKSGEAQGADKGCTPALETSVDDSGNVYLAITQENGAAA